MKKGFQLYPYLAPTILAPASFYLWWQRYDGHWQRTLMAWLLPVIYAYIVPGLGTNYFKVWEFDTRFRLGRFRPQHGFVFGSSTALIAWCCHAQPAHNLTDVLRLMFVFASVLGFWNVLYDVKAIKAGILKVYNQPWAEGQGAEAITFDYAPWFFAGFGAVYGMAVGLAEWMQEGLDAACFAWFFPLMLVCAMAVPVMGYRRRSFRLHGHSGCRPVDKNVS